MLTDANFLMVCLKEAFHSSLEVAAFITHCITLWGLSTFCEIEIFIVDISRTVIGSCRNTHTLRIRMNPFCISSFQVLTGL
jgi:hypothetical protein